MDEICYQSGDTSSDHNWYIKRFLLTGIYTSTELYLLNDSSTQQRDTWAFLERRLEEFYYFTKFQNDMESIVGLGGNFITAFIKSFNDTLSPHQPVNPTSELNKSTPPTPLKGASSPPD